jgi:hypothetical protein
MDARNVWYAAGTGSSAINFNNGIHQIVQLTSGANAITGLTNPKNGYSYQIMLIQPASGSAGTITVAGTSPAVVGTIAGTPSLTNGKRNMLVLTYDPVTNPSAPYFMAAIGPEQ